MPLLAREVLSRSKELEDIVVADLVLAFAFTMADIGGAFGSSMGAYAMLTLFVVSLVAVTLSFVLHEMMHKFVAQRFGAIAAFRRSDSGLMITLFASLFGFLVGIPGATVIYNHRDGRTITDSVWLLTDPAAATAAVTEAQSAVTIANAKTESVAVGTGGQFISGTSSDGSKGRALLSFTEGNAASTIEFTGPANDPVPTSLAVELGQAQDSLIKSKLGT